MSHDQNPPSVLPSEIEVTSSLPPRLTLERRDVLRAGALGLVLAGGLHPRSAHAAVGPLLYADGTFYGYSASVTGGGIVYDPVDTVGSGSTVAKKSKPTPRYQDALVELSFNTSGLVWDWVNTLLSPSPSLQRQVVLSEVNSSFNETLRRVLDRTKLTGFELPVLDASVAGATTIKLKLTPTTIVYEKGSGGRPTTIGQKQKVVSSSRFAVAVDGMEGRRIGYVESFAIGRSAQDTPVFSTLALHVPDSDMATWRNWSSQGTGVKKNGSISWLDTAGNTLVSLDLRGLNVSGLSAVDARAAAGKGKTRVALNVESATFGTVGP